MQFGSKLVEFYKPGDSVPYSGIYRVIHDFHHHQHEVTCLSGDAFPECQECGQGVRFSLVAPARSIRKHVHFHSYASHNAES